MNKSLENMPRAKVRLDSCDVIAVARQHNHARNRDAPRVAFDCFNRLQPALLRGDDERRRGDPWQFALDIHGELKAVVASPDVQAQLAKIGMIPIDSPTPEALRSFVETEVARWSKIVQQAGIAGAH